LAGTSKRGGWTLKKHSRCSNSENPQKEFKTERRQKGLEGGGGTLTNLWEPMGADYKKREKERGGVRQE